ncbi:galactose-1-phosphate uridylyltransferase [Pyxidicoccus sp. MSG2]|uniref:galactose-1-phosphate uridylyltransferase n=1 Tax=Pyxidicoccus sp. MSG2 TaxID=2996790 RepID=UPI00226FD123|nr:galactose-1-phosphate uridylyltransferase [Pyxidicoccus sp. MSG2]MCY1024024.1 galactose-1-phosphate uridylyltransferase [Pyxidicoccus sp. MSG2]
MSQFRQSPFTKEWVLLAPERAVRPRSTHAAPARTPSEHFVPSCPFCPGNESLTPPERLRVTAPGGEGWLLRVVPNRYPALTEEGPLERQHRAGRRSLAGVGFHEVLIETPDHALTSALLPEAHVAAILRAYRDRFARLSEDPRIAHVTLFKNHGREAGTSLAHPHSQVIAAPVISSWLRTRLYEARRHWDESGTCVFCEVMREELTAGERIVETSEHFVASAPFASAAPFQVHIYPRRHTASFGDISEPELDGLAKMLRSVLRRLYFGLGNPDFNYVIETAPAEEARVRYYHWHVRLIPRITEVAGFELGSGIAINTVAPEDAAEFLRNVDVESMGPRSIT